MQRCVFYVALAVAVVRAVEHSSEFDERRILYEKAQLNLATNNLREALPILKQLCASNDTIAGQAHADLSHLFLFGACPTAVTHAPHWRTGEGSVVRRDVDTAVAHAQAAHELGSAQGAHVLALAHLYGLGGIQENVVQAVALEEHSARGQHLPAMMAMGFKYLYGIDGVHQHCVSALALYKEAAEQALASDTNLLVVHTDITLRARRLSNADRLTETDWKRIISTNTYDEAMRYYTTSVNDFNTRESLEYGARRNDVASLLEVAQMYEWGLYGAAVDTAKALRMYETAASLHDPQAITAIGRHYLNEGDREHALELFSLALSYGDPSAAAYMVLANVDNSSIASGYLDALLEDDPHCHFVSGESRGQTGAAVEHYRAGAKQVCTAGTSVVGYVWHNIWNKPESECYKYVAESGPWAGSIRRKALEKLYVSDYTGALLVWSAAAEEGYEVAQHNAGWMMRVGKGIRGDNRFRQALRVLRMAILQDGWWSYFDVGAVIERQGDVAGASQHYARGTYMGDRRAIERYAKMLETGTGTEQKLDEAEQLYKYLIENVDATEARGLDAFMRKASLSVKIAKIRMAKQLRKLFGDSTQQQKPKRTEDTPPKPPKTSTAQSTQQHTSEKGGTAQALQSQTQDANLFFLMDLTDNECLTISGELADCTLESLFTLSPAGHLFAPLAAGHVSIEGHPSATPSLVRTDCDRTHSPLRVGPHTHCGSPNWRFEDQGLVCTQDSQTLCLWREGDTAVVQPCDEGSTTLVIVQLGDAKGQGDGVMFSVSDTTQCWTGNAIIECDHTDPSQRWGLEVSSLAPSGVVYFSIYLTHTSPQSRPEKHNCVSPVWDAQTKVYTLFVGDCEDTGQWSFNRSQIQWGIDDSAPLCVSAVDGVPSLAACDDERAVLFAVRV